MNLKAAHDKKYNTQTDSSGSSSDQAASSGSSSDNVISWSDNKICRFAVTRPKNGQWETNPKYKEQVKDAKRRGLSCGIELTEAENNESGNSIQVTSSENQNQNPANRIPIIEPYKGDPLFKSKISYAGNINYNSFREWHYTDHLKNYGANGSFIMGIWMKHYAYCSQWSDTKKEQFDIFKEISKLSINDAKLFKLGWNKIKTFSSCNGYKTDNKGGIEKYLNNLEILVRKELGLIETTENVQTASNQGDASTSQNKDEENKQEEELLAKEKKAEEERIAPEKKSEEEKRRLQKLNFESKLMVADISEYAKLPNELDTIKLAELFIDYSSVEQGEWNEEKINKYNLLVEFVLSDVGFKNYKEQKDLERNQIKQGKVNELTSILADYEQELKEFVSNNLGSALSKTAIDLSKKINSTLENPDIVELTLLIEEIKKFKEEENKITSLQLTLSKYEKELKLFISDNLESNLIPEALALSKEIKNQNYNLIKLTELVGKITQWFDKNGILTLEEKAEQEIKKKEAEILIAKKEKDKKLNQLLEISFSGLAKVKYSKDKKKFISDNNVLENVLNNKLSAKEFDELYLLAYLCTNGDQPKCSELSNKKDTIINEVKENKDIKEQISRIDKKKRLAKYSFLEDKIADLSNFYQILEDCKNHIDLSEMKKIVDTSIDLVLKKNNVPNDLVDILIENGWEKGPSREKEDYMAWGMVLLEMTKLQPSSTQWQTCYQVSDALIPMANLELLKLKN